MSVRVQREDFDLAAELGKLCAGNHAVGGLCAFTGLVRDMNDGGSVDAMTLEHYPGMTEKMLSRIEESARARWPLEDCLVIHRFGRLAPGDQIVLVAAASAHREAAFEACHFLIDYLKTEAPFWKVEEDDAGAGHWVKARQSDNIARKGWEEK